MKKLLPLAFGAALLTLGACNNDKPVETTREDNSASGDTAVVMRTGPDAEAMYRARARRIADKVYTDFHMQDTAARTRLTAAYTGRARRLGGLRQQYQSDTTGQYQAMRQAEMESDREIQTIFTDPNQYKEYESHRGEYADDKFVDASTQLNSDGSQTAMGDDQTTGATGTTTESTSGSASGSAVNGGTASSGAMEAGAPGGDKTKIKIKAEDGSKLKAKKGDIKYKDANGEKTKVNGD